MELMAGAFLKAIGFFFIVKMFTLLSIIHKLGEDFGRNHAQDSRYLRMMDNQTQKQPAHQQQEENGCFD